MSLVPPNDARARVQKLGAWMEINVPETFGLGSIRDEYGVYRADEIDYDAGYAATCERLRNDFSTDEVERSVAEYLGYPVEGGLANREKRWPLHFLAFQVCERLAKEYENTYALELILKRLEYMLTHPLMGTEFEVNSLTSQSRENLYYAPGIKACVEFVIASIERPEVLPAIRSMVFGEWDVPAPVPKPDDVTYNIDLEKSGYELSGRLIARVEWLRALFDRGELDYDAYRRAADANPYMIQGRNFAPSRLGAHRNDGDSIWPEPPEDDFEEAMRTYTERLVWEAVQALDERAVRVVSEVYYHSPFGAKYLLKACEHVQALGVKNLRFDSYEDRDRSLRFLSGIAGLAPGGDADELVKELKGFNAATLKVVFPHAGVAEELVMQALGWESVLPLRLMVRSIARVQENGWKHAKDLENSSDPSSGVVDRQAILDALANAGEKNAKAWMGVMKKCKAPCQKTLRLVQACAGWNRDDITKKLGRQEQLALKALGLLPIEGEQEVLERYLALRQAAKEGARYGPERQANIRAAVEAGLSNLANTVGYADSGRLEWAMESKLAAESPVGQTHDVDDWTVCLEMQAEGPAIAIDKKGKRLKSVPKPVRQSDIYKELMAAKQALKAQASRCRVSLEGLMTSEETLSGDELKEICTLPVLRDYLQRLVLISDGNFGTYDPEAHQLMGFEGQRFEIGAEARLAHPLHFFENQTLSDWQREIVERGIVQPFKQVFRELYVLTPAEATSERFSHRFAGHALNPQVASRLFQNRGWQLGASEYESPYRRFPALDLIANFTFPDVGHYLAETDVITSDQVDFTASKKSSMDRDERGRVRLADVPPIVFSEVMRDCDLVVSVAQLAEEEDARVFSKESFARRSELVSALIPKLGLKRVTVDGHFVRVRGTRANYRVHLGSAAIHIEPGNYLCVVPAEASKKTGLFLPFATADDNKAAEVVSKIFLLANDETIKDRVILDQIERKTR